MDLSQRILGVLAAEMANQAVSPLVFADVIGTTPAHALAILMGDGELTRPQLRLACEYLEIDLAEALLLPGCQDC